VKVGDLVGVKDSVGTLPIGIVVKILESGPRHVAVSWNDCGPILEEYVEDLEVISEVTSEGR